MRPVVSPARTIGFRERNQASGCGIASSTVRPPFRPRLGSGHLTRHPAPCRHPLETGGFGTRGSSPPGGAEKGPGRRATTFAAGTAASCWARRRCAGPLCRLVASPAPILALLAQPRSPFGRAAHAEPAAGRSLRGSAPSRPSGNHVSYPSTLDRGAGHLRPEGLRPAMTPQARRTRTQSASTTG